MDSKELRGQIRWAIRSVWPEFARTHPRLAGLLDHGTVLDAAAEHFQDDAECLHKLADAAAREMAEQEMAMLIRGLVKDWLHGLA